MQIVELLCYINEFMYILNKDSLYLQNCSPICDICNQLKKTSQATSCIRSSEGKELPLFSFYSQAPTNYREHAD